MAVAAHEIAHKKGHHALYRTVITMIFVSIAGLSWSRFTAPILFNEAFTQALLQIMMEVALLAFMMVAMIPASWLMELKADKAAARFVGNAVLNQLCSN